MLLVEDLHWVDASSLELLSLLVEQVATAPICVLLTARPDFRPPWPALSHTIQVTLTRLPRRQTEQMVLSVAGGKALPGEVLQQVLAGADGVPLFVEEITKMVLESGLLRDGEARYELQAPLGSLAIPATLHDSLMARLDRLPEARPVAQLAATIGREFSYELLGAISALEPSRSPARSARSRGSCAPPRASDASGSARAVAMTHAGSWKGPRPGSPRVSTLATSEPRPRS